jgi:hypothetical protein
MLDIDKLRLAENTHRRSGCVRGTPPWIQFFLSTFTILLSHSQYINIIHIQYNTIAFGMRVRVIGQAQRQSHTWMGSKPDASQSKTLFKKS